MFAKHNENIIPYFVKVFFTKKQQAGLLEK